MDGKILSRYVSMSWFTATFQCDSCGTKWDDMIKRSEKDDAHTNTCPGCLLEECRERVLGMPMIMKESYPDGHRRRHDDNYKRMKIASSMQRQAYNLPHDSKERKDLMERSEKVKKKESVE